MYYRIFLACFFCTFWYGAMVRAQDIGHGNVPDSLMNYIHEERKDLYKPLMEVDSTTAAFYINAHIKKAKLEKDFINQAVGYDHMNRISEHAEGLVYLDSIVQLTNHIKSDYCYPAYGFFWLGFEYYQQGNYESALDNLMLANETVHNDNKGDKWRIKGMIASLKNRSGDYLEAHEISKEIFEEIQNQVLINQKYANHYPIALINYSISFLYLKDFNNAERYCLLALKEAQNQGYTSRYWYYRSSLGEIKYKQGFPREAIPLLTESLPYEIDYSLANNYVFRGKAYWDLNQTKKALLDFEKADSIVQQTQDFLPEMLGVYATLNGYYRERKQPAKQQEYIDKLIYVDSVLDADALYLGQEIKNQYDIPLLLAERQELIDGLEAKTNRYANWIYLLSLALGGTLLFGLYYYRKRLGYKKKFEALMNEKTAAAPSKVLQKIESQELQISEEVVQRVLTQLETYEQDQGYLQPGISLQKLSKTLDTNSNYLSKIINVYRNKNFSSYISDLRIAYALEALKHNSTLRRYTIKAIAAETGFGSAESFTTAFYRKTGIYPSYYIKQLNKEEKDERPLR